MRKLIVNTKHLFLNEKSKKIINYFFPMLNKGGINKIKLFNNCRVLHDID